MPPSHLDTIRRHCQPLDPIPTDMEPVLAPVRDIQAVLFDVYGTLFISASGDVGTAMSDRRAEAMRDALQAIGLKLLPARTPADAEADVLIASIQAAHQQARERGVTHPEVDILSVWDDALQRLRAQGRLDSVPSDIDLSALAIEYEVRTNPTWPMPGAVDCLQAIQDRGLLLGIVSNAQFFTRDLFTALLGHSTEALGFAPELQFFSYQSGWAKPGSFLYERSAEALSTVGVLPHNVLYIGNDMLNDVAAAHAVGFQTVLFAGDDRSLRLRRDDPRVADVRPDLTITHLSQLIECID